MELNHSIDELFPKCKIRPKSSIRYHSDSNSDSDARSYNHELYVEGTDEDSEEEEEEEIKKCIRRSSSSSSMEYREEAEGEEDQDSREEAEGREEEKNKEDVEDGEVDSLGYQKEDENDFEEEQKEENEMHIDNDKEEDVDGDCDDDSMDDIQQIKERRNSRLRKSFRKSRRDGHNRNDFIDTEDEFVEEFCNESSPTLVTENAPPPLRKCVPHRGFWKRTKDNIGSGFTNFWEKIKDGSRGIKSRIRSDWSRKNQKKTAPLNDETNSYEGEDEEETLSKSSKTKPK